MTQDTITPEKTKRQVIIGVADMAVSDDANDLLVTHALGSCLGIMVHDPVAGVAGLLHVMLPLSKIDPIKAADNPAMFIDTGVPRLFKECYRLGAVKQRLMLKVAGGASLNTSPDGEDFFQIGKRNMIMLRKLLWKNGVIIENQDVGGSISRTVRFDVRTGEVQIASKGKSTPL